MKRCLVVLFVLAVLCMAVGAQAFTFYIRDGAAVGPATSNDWMAGVATTGSGTYVSNFVPLLFAPAQQTFNSPTVIVWGRSDIALVGGSGPGTFSPGTGAWFDFDIGLDPAFGGALTHRMEVEATITGEVDVNQSNAQWQIQRIHDLTDNTYYNYVAGTKNPNEPTREAVFLNPVIGGQQFALWLNQMNSIPKPVAVGAAVPVSIEGYAAVPEPSSLGLLLGFGISGSLFMLRRKRG